MIRVTVEIIPHGIEKAAFVVGGLIVANDGTDKSHETGNYTVEFFGNPPMSGDIRARKVGREKRTGKVRLVGFPRKDKNFWSLLLTALIKAGRSRATSKGRPKSVHELSYMTILGPRIAREE